MEKVDSILSKLPNLPGVYLFKDKNREIIYIGKAKDIKKRVSQYFRAKPGSLKTRLLVSKIECIDFICTSSEKEALLLEFSLIKKYRPKFNIVLRDDKAYLLFKLDYSHPYPRLQLTRKVVKKNKCKYFGPYTSANAARQTFSIINKIFPLRKCKDTIFRNRTRPCLEYHINRCLGPCCIDVDKSEYMTLVKQVEMFLQGKNQNLIKELEKNMWHAANQFEFEKAAILRDRIVEIKKTLEQQRVILPQHGDIDIVAIEQGEDVLGIGVLFVRNGRMLDHKSFVFAKEKSGFWGGERDDLVMQDILRSFLFQFYSTHPFIPNEIVLPFELEDRSIEEFLREKKKGRVRIIFPTKSLYKDLMRLARLNIFKGQRTKDWSRLMGISKIFSMCHIPNRIEVVDASHLGGKITLVGQVVYENGDFKKQDYRVYRFSNLDGSMDDYLTLGEWAKRRYKSGPPWPDLLIIDGGKGQLNVVLNVFKEIFNGSVPFKLISIAKGKGRGGGDKVYVPGRKNPLPMAKGSKELLFIQLLRDNCHRYVIGNLKKRYSKYTIKSSIENITGVGPKTAKLLWNNFNSLEGILNVSLEDLQKVSGIGRKRAKQIYSGLQKIKEQVKNLEKSK